MLFEYNNTDKDKPIGLVKFKAMVKEFRVNLRAISTDILQRKYPVDPRHRPEVGESKFTWVSKDEVNAFFQQNSTANGMRIYFAVHNESTLPTTLTDDSKECLGQLTVIFVPTAKRILTDGAITHDDLTIGAFATGTSYSGFADNDFPLCPPQCPTGGTNLLNS